MHGFTIILHTLFESIKEKARKLLEFCFPKKQVGGLLRVQSFLHGLLPQLLLLPLLQLFQLKTRGYCKKKKNYEQSRSSSASQLGAMIHSPFMQNIPKVRSSFLQAFKVVLEVVDYWAV